jgi:hypothetical protein
MDKLKKFYIKPYSVSPRPISEECIYSDFPQSGISIDPDNWTEIFKKNHPMLSTKEVNAFGFRSDNFKTEHFGLHVLFLGCSYTWGTGLYLDEVWSKILYDKISNETNTSGFFNLGVPGDSIYSSINNAFKYFKHFGNPSVIFFNVQDIGRFYAEDEDEKVLHRSNLDSNKVLDLTSYQSYYALEQYCRSHDITLISFTWYLGHDPHPLKDFESFKHISMENIAEFVLKYKENNPSVEEAMLAKDGRHLGIAYHEYWAYNAYKIYNIEKRIHD